MGLMIIWFFITVMQDKDKSAGAGQIKKLVSGLDANRKAVESGTDVSANLYQAK